ncbi:Zinc finger transcription factor ace1 [Lachnellula suecica]|uniref:Zinc finger transcription factor ace1 n=1 Tax=Lachnellula suecica TaxID=602035 RepID=A0A8T9C6I0_9HELO|nr:Zinc finger transcription factor ace1 [Lachnellula suecica]
MSSYNHPRRTTKTTSSALTPTPTSSSASGRPTVNTNMSLRKGATFHSPSSPDCDVPEPFKVPALPRRSQSTLDDVVDAHKRRVALTLGDIDRGLAAVEERSPTARQSFPDEADPVPQGFLNHTVGSPSTKSYGSIMDGPMSSEPSSIGRRSLRPRHNRRPSRYSDSALGSSIGSKSGKNAADTAPTSVTDEKRTKSVAASAITRSAAAHSSTIESLSRLSTHANNRIHEHILRPLLAKPSLRDFHPIVKDCPRRIHGKEIVCLRDLEKTLIFMAPVSDIHTDDVVGGVAHWFSRLKERTKTAALYLDFCLTSIRCIQATVETLSPREQTRPHDRPYTNGYFVDLVDQIQQYAQQIQAAKEREAKGEKLTELDPESTDEVRLHGGLTKNGRPAELIRVKKNGKAVSVATGLPVELEDEDSKEAMRFKRSLSQEAEDDEAIMRSMARRKRSASAAELAPKRCREAGCDKEFKRPCDLTKHEKTHSRPWKCPVESCKYHDYGWPTEKEMDRHHNDKHSSAPPLYECHYKPCPYRSKRESNCKQHMEKAHGWEYVRSKNNGKNREKGAEANTNNGLPTPQTTNIRTPSSDGNNMATPGEEDMEDVQTGYDGSAWNDDSHLNFPEYNSDMEMFPTNQQLQLDYSPISDMNQSGSISSNDQSPYIANTLPGQDHFQDNFQDNFQNFNNNNVDFSLFENEDLYSANVHLPTPSHEVYQRAMAGFEPSCIPFAADPIPHISPVGHGNTMLYTPTSMRDVDEGFEDFVPANCNPQLGTQPPALSSAKFPHHNGFPGVSAQDLLDFYAATTAAATQHHRHNNVNHNVGMDWSSDDQYAGYRSH